MKQPTRPATADGLFLWVMHRFAEEFDHQAMLKGGMALRLLESPRSTTDIEYVFVPRDSKREVGTLVERVLAGLDEARVEVAVHSKMVRATVHLDEAAIQVEATVAPECPSLPMATGEFARSLGHPSQVVPVMHFDLALADKLAAWNERRLLRDLYDVYFLAARLGAHPDLDRLDRRLGKVESRIPELRQRKRMSRADLAAELHATLLRLDDERVARGLGPLLPPADMAGLAVRIRAAVSGVAEVLAAGDSTKTS